MQFYAACLMNWGENIIGTESLVMLYENEIQIQYTWIVAVAKMINTGGLVIENVIVSAIAIGSNCERQIFDGT